VAERFTPALVITRRPGDPARIAGMKRATTVNVIHFGKAP
jgi:hypothetical protein